MNPDSQIASPALDERVARFVSTRSGTESGRGRSGSDASWACVSNSYRRLSAAGVPVTVNSDDPPMFNTTLTDELMSLARFQGFTPAELANLTCAAVEVSFLPADEKATLRAEVEAGLTEAAREAGVSLEERTRR